jgi:DNA-binding transcriptional regulator WhiA
MRYETTWSFWYICGVAEDVYLKIDPQKGYEFDLDSVSYAWLEQIKPLLEQKLQKELIIRPHSNRKHFRLRFFDKELINAIYNVKVNPRVVKHINCRFQQYWIAGFFDAEGSVTLTGTDQPMLSIYSTNREKITILRKLLNLFSMHSGIYLPSNRTVYQLFLTGRANIKRFVHTIPFHHPAKLKRIRRYT